MSIALFTKLDLTLRRPSTALYISFFLLSFITINTYFLVFFEIQYRYSLWVFLALGYLISVFANQRFKPYLEFTINIAAFAIFIYFMKKIMIDKSNFGAMFGLILCWFLVLRSYLLFSREDFVLPLIMSLPLILLCAIPSYESNYVISLQAYMVLIIVSLYFLAKFREMDESKGGRTELERFKKVLTAKTESKLIIAFLVLVFFISSLVYFSTPRHPERALSARSVFRTIVARDASDIPQNPNDPTLQGQGDNQSDIYPGLNENEFTITQGQSIRNGPFADEVVMEVHVGYPSYMRAMVWDRYHEDGRWTRSPQLYGEYPLTGFEHLEGPLNAWRYETSQNTEIKIDALKQSVIEYEGTVYLPKNYLASSYVFLPWYPTSVTLPFKTLYFNKESTEVKLRRTDSPSLRPSRMSSYRFKSATYFPSGLEKALLKETSGGDFLDRYTQLPEKVHEPINGKTLDELCNKIVRDANANTNYEKTLAVFNYLRTTGKYSLNPPACPPEYDTISYFMLEVKPQKGHCELYSSSMVVMLRVLGIPSRIATGYSPGSYSFTRNRYIIRERDAHAWVEAYFPELGWLPFDPTPSNAWVSTGEKIEQVIASASNFINEMYVYDFNTFYVNRIKPPMIKISSATISMATRLDRITPPWLKRHYPLIIALCLILAALIYITAFTRAWKASITERTLYLTRRYYWNLVRRLRKKGCDISPGSTPFEVLTKIKSDIPECYEDANNFMTDFWIINYAPRFMREESLKKVKNEYARTIASINKNARNRNRSI